jgi:hypothetical protein
MAAEQAKELRQLELQLMTYVRTFKLHLKHVPGDHHQGPDALSRNPLPHPEIDFDVPPLPGEDVETDNTALVSAVTTRAQAAQAASKHPSAEQQSRQSTPPPSTSATSESDDSASETESELPVTPAEGSTNWSALEEDEKPLEKGDNPGFVFDVSEYVKQQHLDPKINQIAPSSRSPSSTVRRPQDNSRLSGRTTSMGLLQAKEHADLPKEVRVSMARGENYTSTQSGDVPGHDSSRRQASC